jgi:hypothetical protein
MLMKTEEDSELQAHHLLDLIQEDMSHIKSSKTSTFTKESQLNKLED